MKDMREYFTLFVSLFGFSALGCSDYHTPKHYQIVDQDEIVSIEFASQSNKSWHQIERGKWTEIMDCIRDNQEWQPKNEREVHWDLPGFAYHLKIKHSDGTTTLLSFYSGDKLFCEDQSTSLYTIEEIQGQRLRQILECSISKQRQPKQPQNWED
jgi:hypothetical protein